MNGVGLPHNFTAPRDHAPPAGDRWYDAAVRSLFPIVNDEETARMRALLSVYDKTGLVPFAQHLHRLGFDLVSTGGTYAALVAAGLPVTAVADVTGFPEILDGRVKTLHPKIHGGLLARLDLESHQDELSKHSIFPISLLVGNLYPFEATISKSGVTLEDAAEHIDIGGPAMIRAAAKNFAHVTVIVDPADFEQVIGELEAGGTSIALRRALAAKAFAHVSSYDSLIATYLSKTDFPDELTLAGRKVFEPRYGENPHQRAAVYRLVSAAPTAAGVFDAKKLSGKELSFNNLLDADSAWSLVHGVTDPAVCVVKHTIPCGFAIREHLADAYSAAYEGDPVSAFGGIVALNRAVDAETSNRMAGLFLEIIIAPGFEPEALAVLAKKKQLRLLAMAQPQSDSVVARQIRSIAGGFLIQESDHAPDEPSNWKTATHRAPTAAELHDAAFAWRLARYVKSNAIVIAKDRAAFGVGAGQPNRRESVRLAVAKAGERAKGAALASDAYFPFPDGLETAIAAGVTCVIQPGGSVRDDLVIAAANEAGIAMIFTGVRHFLH